MTDSQKQTPELDINQLTENLFNATLNYQQVATQIFANTNQDFENVKIDPFNLTETFMKAMHEVWSDPNKAAQNHLELASNYMKLWHNVTQRFMGHEVDPMYKGEHRDHRFADDAWEAHPMFDFIKQSYFLNAAWVQDIVRDVKGLDPKDYHKLEFYTKMLVDAMAPSNFAHTNPAVIRETLATNGTNLLKGAENFMKDMQKAEGGKFKISTTDYDAFEVGKNLAITPGKVVHQNKLMQLIQYEPTTKEVHKTPLVMMPAWINKYYIFDLQEKNSYVKWLVDQGYTVFMISWVNPDEELGHKNFEDYMRLGPLEAMDVVKKQTGEEQMHFMGYCLGGTLLAATIAYLDALSNKRPIKSATFLTCLVDFSDAGDLAVFVDDDQISHLEKRMSEKGYLDGHEMAQTFSMIRANDMIWSFYINNYLLGKDPFPFDILYWNADSTRLPATVHSFYLRQMYEKNLLAKPNGIKLLDTPIDLRKIDVPVYILSTIDDHITPWEGTYKATQIYTGKTRFVLSGSGHVAGVMNHPSKEKYCYWTNDKIESTPNKWFKGVKETKGSWWPDWDKWAAKQSGDKVPARKIKEGKKKLPKAPGSYVKVRLDSK